jgi:hypothetical protein
VAGVISVLAGGLGSSVIFYMLVNNEWDIYQKIGSSLIAFIFVTMPYFWVLFLFIFIISADYYLKHTKYGYRFSLAKIVFLSIVMSIALGALFYNAGVGEAIDNEFSKRIPVYNNLIYNKEKLWMQPEKGLLVGTILKIENNDNFTVVDLNGKNWGVVGEELFIRRMVDFKVGGQIKIIGEMKSDNVFAANELRPWSGRMESCNYGIGHGMRFLNN